MSCPEWECSCGEITFGFSKRDDGNMLCHKCGKVLDHYIYDEEIEERAEQKADEEQRMEERHNDDHYSW